MRDFQIQAVSQALSVAKLGRNGGVLGASALIRPRPEPMAHVIGFQPI